MSKYIPIGQRNLAPRSRYDLGDRDEEAVAAHREYMRPYMREWRLKKRSVKNPRRAKANG
jgi:hypothetical protein